MAAQKHTHTHKILTEICGICEQMLAQKPSNQDSQLS